MNIKITSKNYLLAEQQASRLALVNIKSFVPSKCLEMFQRADLFFKYFVIYVSLAMNIIVVI